MPDNEDKGKTVTEERRGSGGSKKSFDVLFAGLFCFKKEAGIAVMPDGTVPDDATVQPHEAFLVVDPKDVISAPDWPTDPRTAQGIYTLSKCTIKIPPATDLGNIERDHHDANVTKAIEFDPDFEYMEGWDSRIIATVTIGQGTLEFLRRPDRPSTEKGLGMVSRLTVPHEENVVVRVEFNNESKERVLTLNPGSAVAIVNGVLTTDATKTGDPLSLFGQITDSGTFTRKNQPPQPNVGVISRNYQLFKINLPFTLADSIGCCPPP